MLIEVTLVNWGSGYAFEVSSDGVRKVVCRYIEKGENRMRLDAEMPLYVKKYHY